MTFFSERQREQLAELQQKVDDQSDQNTLLSSQLQVQTELINDK